MKNLIALTAAFSVFSIGSAFAQTVPASTDITLGEGTTVFSFSEANDGETSATSSTMVHNLGEGMVVHTSADLLTTTVDEYSLESGKDDAGNDIYEETRDLQVSKTANANSSVGYEIESVNDADGSDETVNGFIPVVEEVEDESLAL